MATFPQELETFLNQLDGVQERDGYWMARCPAHNDSEPSLKISVGDDRILIHCFGGCQPEAVLDALNLSWRDLFLDGRDGGRHEADTRDEPRRHIEATYDYRDERGDLVFQVVRYAPKSFRQRRPDGEGGWIWNMKGVPRVLYRLPELLSSRADEPVFVVEGEKSCDELRQNLSVVATTNSGGAGKWSQGGERYTEPLRGRRVVVIPDADGPGRAHADQVARSLVGIAADVRVVELPDLSEKQDVVDWIRAGGTREALDRRIAETPPHVITKREEPPLSACPPLPQDARLSAAQREMAASCGALLDQYVAFASEASPLTPIAFHEMAALFVISVAVARRVRLRVSTASNAIYPNLYLLFVGQSTLPRKTTALRVLRGLLTEAKLDRFLLADRQTPEALALDLTTSVPPSFAAWADDVKKEWREERAFAGQRAWVLEEASHLLDSFNRDYSAGLLPFVLDLFDCSDQGPRRNTIGRGRERIRHPYMSIFGATTYGAMAQHTSQRLHWANGLYARLIMVCSDEIRKWVFWPDPLEYPDQLVKRLHDIAYGLLPLPKVRLVESAQAGGEDGVAGYQVVVDQEIRALDVHVDPDAWAAWERYAKAVSHDLLLENPPVVPERLRASYGRMGTRLVKVAMLLAVADAEQPPITVRAKHVYRAQLIVESWRTSLHTLMGRLREEATSGRKAEVVSVLRSANGQWVSRRQLCRALSCTIDDLLPAIDELCDSGLIERSAARNKRGPASERYRLAPDAR